MIIDLSKDELCLISIALNEYQMDRDNYHLDEITATTGYDIINIYYDIQLK